MTTPNSTDTTAATQQKLCAVFNTTHVHITDNSWQHAGHAAMKGITHSSGTHLALQVVSTQFEGISSLQRHRLVQKALKAEFNDRLHAIQVQALTPQEWESRQQNSPEALS